LGSYGGCVGSVSVTADGRRAVSGGLHEAVRMWDLASGECLQMLQGHRDRVTSASVTADGRRVVSGGEDRTVRVWDPESGKCLQVLVGHSDQVTSVSVTTDGKRAVSGSEDRTVRMWDLETGECLRMLTGHSRGIESVSVTADGRRAVSGGADRTLRMWDLESGECVAVFIATAPVLALATTSSQSLIMATSSGEVLVAEVRNLAVGPPLSVAVDSSDAAHEAALRRGLDHCRQAKGADPSDTLSHLIALAVHLENSGRTDDARALRKEHGLSDLSRVEASEELQDELYTEALQLVTETRGVSISFVQRRLRVGYNRAARMIEKMEQEGMKSLGRWLCQVLRRRDAEVLPAGKPLDQNEGCDDNP
jgi:Ftsk gamma domain/WD domain, G-beta repeat